MKYSEDIRSISYLKSNAAEIIRSINKNNKTIIITQNGEAKAIVQDIATYEQLQESLALLKLLAQSNANMRQGKIKSIDQTFSDLVKKIKRHSAK
jgi:prevent-host-death family protein